jgi:hypothetical protein
MRIKINIVPALLAVLVTLVALPVHAAEDYWQDLRSLPFPESYPTKQSADRLHDEMLFQRAHRLLSGQFPSSPWLNGNTPTPSSWERKMARLYILKALMTGRVDLQRYNTVCPAVY